MFPSLTIGVDTAPLCQEIANITTNVTIAISDETVDCLTEAVPTSLTTKIVYALWIWAIYFTSPGQLVLSIQT